MSNDEDVEENRVDIVNGNQTASSLDFSDVREKRKEQNSNICFGVAHEIKLIMPIKKSIQALET